jgi:hypothetical protein
VALSLYYKGRKSDWPWKKNTICPPDYIDQLISGSGSEGGNSLYNFYEMFSTKYGKPFAVILEMCIVFCPKLISV